MKKLILSAAQEKLLREQVFDADHPGTLLRDFQTVLDFIGPGGVRVAAKSSMLLTDEVTELDGRLTRPLRLQLKRAMPSSHPYLQGLHLLLRATGLGRAEGSATSPRLTLDPAMMDLWTGLNATERYFTLLEAWLVVGRPEMVCEGSRGWLGTTVMDCLQLWHSIPAGGVTFNLEKPQEVFLPGIYRTFYHVALAGLFGLLEVEHPATAVMPWRPASLKHRSFGDAVFTLLWNRCFVGGRGYNLAIDGRFGILQALFRPHFPAWQKTLVLPEVQGQEGVYVFKVSLGNIWLLIALPSSNTLAELADAILDSVNFDDDHLYEFTWRDRFGAKATAGHDYTEEPPFASEMELGKLDLRPGQTMKFLFDFGDNWLFDIKLERIDPPSPRMKKPRVLESHGKTPEQYPRWE